MKECDVFGGTKRMEQGEGMDWMGLYKDGISGAMRRNKVGALFWSPCL